MNAFFETTNGFNFQIIDSLIESRGVRLTWFDYNSREIVIDGKPFFIQEWFSKGIILIRDLLDEQGQLLSYQAFKTKYKCKTNFLNYSQVRSAIPDSLLAKTKNNNLEPFSKSIFLQNHSIFDL